MQQAQQGGAAAAAGAASAAAASAAAAAGGSSSRLRRVLPYAVALAAVLSVDSPFVHVDSIAAGGEDEGKAAADAAAAAAGAQGEGDEEGAEEGQEGAARKAEKAAEKEAAKRKRQAARQAHAQFRVADSDALRWAAAISGSVEARGVCGCGEGRQRGCARAYRRQGRPAAGMPAPVASYPPCTSCYQLWPLCFSLLLFSAARCVCCAPLRPPARTRPSAAATFCTSAICGRPLLCTSSWRGSWRHRGLASAAALQRQRLPLRWVRVAPPARCRRRRRR